ncbi:hypothetical protein D915_005728 [Fasciola hepatica]|uniref:PDEase domain-containing protein n=1 Tax=Fasciola hepatica TaxID=6192 RepID=A0A4E0RBP5_FASHE|nr:hypothetical protein D915_005728 [Fasciola hepatica]
MKPNFFRRKEKESFRNTINRLTWLKTDEDPDSEGEIFSLVPTDKTKCFLSTCLPFRGRKLFCCKAKKKNSGLISDGESYGSHQPGMDSSGSRNFRARTISEMLIECDALEPNVQKFISSMLEKIGKDITDAQSREHLLEYFSTLIAPQVPGQKETRQPTMWDHRFRGMTTNINVKLDLKSTLGFKFDKGAELFEFYRQETKFWSLDIFAMDQLLGGRALIVMLQLMLEELNLFQLLKIDRCRLLTFAALLDANYLPNPYHNQIHGADVTHAVTRLLQTKRIRAMTSSVEKFALVVAAAAHDVGHPGVTNQFLINTSHPLAITYNDISVLENYHCASVFALMECKGGNIVQDFSTEDRRIFRRTVINSLILYA